MPLCLASPRILAGGQGSVIRGAGWRPAVVVALASLVSLALSWPQVQAVWATGTFFDPDDAMRMIQVRAWLAGQSWFDLTVHRLDPPAGLLMHWSRVVDVPLGALIRLFGAFAAQDTAELLARLVFPLLLQILLIGATVFAASVLAGPASAIPAAALIAASGFQFGQFVPGRIDHHAPQIVLLMLMTGFAADVLRNARRRSAALAALAIGCSMAISLENLPFIAVVIGAVALAWAVQGPSQSAALQAFGLALIAGALTFFIGTVPPWRYLTTVADAFALPHLLALALGGGALAVLAARHDEAGTPLRRIAALILAGALVFGFVALTCPGVLCGPYAEIDPVVRTAWLSHVTEALPLSTALRLHPQDITLVGCPILVCLVATAGLIYQTRGRVRAGWALVGILALVGVAGSCWELRVASSTMPLAILGGVGAVTAVMTRVSSRGQAEPYSHLLACALGLGIAPLAWLVVPVPDPPAAVSAGGESAAGCRAAENLTPLAQLDPGLVFASIDSGSHLLVHTRLSVLGAPYHRNNRGNRTVIEGFSADPAEAERIIKASGARYIAICPGQVVENRTYTDRNPRGLAAALLAGQVPRWLEPRSVAGSTYQVFAVR